MRQLFLRHRRRYATWATRGVTALAASALVGAGPRSAEAQLAYNGTTFVHGFASSPKIWLDGYPDLGGRSSPGYLAQTVLLGTVGTPNLNDSIPFDPEVANLANFTAAMGNTSVFVGHSMGGLAARRFYLNYPGQRGSVASIIAVNSPHQGAPLADNVGSVKGFFFDVQRRVNGASRATIRVYESGAADLVAGVFALFGNGTAAGAFVALGAVLSFSDVGGAKQISVNDIAKLTSVPALADLRTSSTAVQQLNANTADAAVPRANVYGSIPFENAVYRLQAAMSTGDEEAKFRELVHAKNFALRQFHNCRAIGYFTIVNWGNARACGFGIRVLERIDDQWLRATNGTETVTKCYPGGASCYRYTRGRRVPFDGVVPNERSNYPGLTDQKFRFPVSGASHLNVYQRRFGLDPVAQAMVTIGMQRTGASQWTQVGGYLAHVSTGGAGQVWGLNSANEVYRWNGATWDRMPGLLTDVAVGQAGQVWGVNSAGQVYRWNGANWDQMAGLLKEVSVGGANQVWGVNSANEVYRWNGTGWDRMPGYLVQVSVGADGTVWGLNSASEIWRWNGTNWDRMPGYLKDVAVGSASTVWGLGLANDVYRWNGGGWDRITGALKDVSIGSAGTVWGVNSADQIFYRTGG